MNVLQVIVGGLAVACLAPAGWNLHRMGRELKLADALRPRPDDPDPWAYWMQWNVHMIQMERHSNRAIWWIVAASGIAMSFVRLLSRG